MKWIIIGVVALVLYFYFVHGKPRQMRNIQRQFDKLIEQYGLDIKDDIKDDDIKDEEIKRPKLPDYWDFTEFKGDKKRERITRNILETIYSKKFPTVRPDWLKNPKTGHCLEIDCFNEELRLAVEVSGSQHYQQEDHFHRGDRGKFLSQVYRDKVKKEMISNKGIDLIVIPYTIPVSELPSYIIDKLRFLEKLD